MGKIEGRQRKEARRAARASRRARQQEKRRAKKERRAARRSGRRSKRGRLRVWFDNLTMRKAFPAYILFYLAAGTLVCMMLMGI